MFKKPMIYSAVFTILFGLSACGGGDSDSNNDDSNNSNTENESSNDTTDTKTLAITAENAEFVTNTALNTGDSIFSSVDPAGRIAIAFLGSPYTCRDGGTANFEQQNADENNPLTSTGDFINFTFNDCSDGDELSNGSMRIEISDYTDEDNMSMRITLADFSLEDDELSSNISGVINLTTSNDMERLSLQDVTSTVNDATFTYHSMDIEMTSTESSYSTTMSAEITSPELGGRFTISTPQALTSNEEDIYPTMGIYRVDGANGSFVSVNADTGDVETALLTINDGAATTSKTVNWDSLEESVDSGS